jgi:hypothetical protein
LVKAQKSLACFQADAHIMAHLCRSTFPQGLWKPNKGSMVGLYIPGVLLVMIRVTLCNGGRYYDLRSVELSEQVHRQWTEEHMAWCFHTLVITRVGITVVSSAPSAWVLGLCYGWILRALLGAPYASEITQVMPRPNLLAQQQQRETRGGPRPFSGTKVRDGRRARRFVGGIDR